MSGFIVLHSDTGAMDGVYSDAQDALSMLTYWRSEIPGRWALVEAVAGSAGIPDHLFAATVFGRRGPLEGARPVIDGLVGGKLYGKPEQRESRNGGMPTSRRRYAPPGATANRCS